jgi:4'-phosphopantetheinyl transferase
MGLKGLWWEKKMQNPIQHNPSQHIRICHQLVINHSEMQNKIQVWKIVFSDFYPQIDKLITFLSPEEQQKASAFIKLQSRYNFIITRAALHILLCNSLKNKKNKLKYNKYGKPSIDKEPTPLHFNISHAENLALVAFSDYEIGIDVEFMRDNVNFVELAKRFFSQEEYTAVISQSPTMQREVFFNIWSKKEAIIKAIGRGLSHPLNSFTVDWSKNEQLIAINDYNYLLQTLPIEAGYQAAVASDPRAKDVILHEFNIL